MHHNLKRQVGSPRARQHCLAVRARGQSVAQRGATPPSPRPAEQLDTAQQRRDEVRFFTPGIGQAVRARTFRPRLLRLNGEPEYARADAAEIVADQQRALLKPT